MNEEGGIDEGVTTPAIDDVGIEGVEELNPSLAELTRAEASRLGRQLMDQLPVRSLKGLTFKREEVDPRLTHAYEVWVEESRALTRRVREVRRALGLEAQAWAAFVDVRLGRFGDG